MHKDDWITSFGITAGLLVIAVVAVVLLSLKVQSDNNQINQLKKVVNKQNSSLQSCIQNAKNSYNQILQAKLVDPYEVINGLGSSLNASVNACKAQYP